MDSRLRIILALCLTTFFLVAGTVGYIVIEHYTPLEAIYMTVITITTVGFGEVRHLSEAGRVFTIFLLLFGVGSLAFAAHAFTESMIERVWSPARGKRVMEKKISRLSNHTIICGHGRVGEAAAKHLADSQKSFVVLENSPEECAKLKEQGYLYLSGDATSEKTLCSAGIKSAGALLALLDSDPDNLFTVLSARELNPTLHIVARSESPSGESKILRAGADSIISPYASAGRRVADKIMARANKEQLGSSVGGPALRPDFQPKWVEVNEESGLVEHVVETAGVFLAGQIVGVRRDGKDVLSPHLDYQLALGDSLLVVPDRDLEMDEYRPEQPQKIVLVDDNPVIRRLYTRLFQKAGFNIITAATGRDGYDLILEEQPDAAVVDYLLGDISGLEVCEIVRESSVGQNVKLFLFTADESQEVYDKAMKVGVDVVVLKSPDAGEIVNLVRKEVGRKENNLE